MRLFALLYLRINDRNKRFFQNTIQVSKMDASIQDPFRALYVGKKVLLPHALAVSDGQKLFSPFQSINACYFEFSMKQDWQFLVDKTSVSPFQSTSSANQVEFPIKLIHHSE